MRHCFSLDFGQEGCWKRGDGSFQARLAEALRLRHGDNVDEARIDDDLGWVNPAYGGDSARGSWQSLAEIQKLGAEPVYAALEALTGIERDGRGTLRHAPGTKGLGGKAPRDPKRGKKVRKDTTIARSLVLQASPAFFYPKIRAEGWTQEEIDYLDRVDRGPIDEEAVRRFRGAALAWAREEWGDRLVLASFHVDEKSPHMHIVVIPAQDGRLASRQMIASPEASRALIDRMTPYFDGIGLERPTEGGKSTGATYEHFKRLQNLVTELETRLAELEAQRQAADAELAEIRRRAVHDAAMAAGVQAARRAAERRAREAQAEAERLAAEIREAEDRLHAVSGVDAETALAMQEITRAMGELYPRLSALTPDEQAEIWTDTGVREAMEAALQRREASTPDLDM